MSNPRQRIQFVLAMAQQEKPTDEAALEVWETAVQLRDEYREILDTSILKRIRRMPEFSRKTDAFYDEYIAPNL